MPCWRFYSRNRPQPQIEALKLDLSEALLVNQTPDLAPQSTRSFSALKLAIMILASLSLMLNKHEHCPVCLEQFGMLVLMLHLLHLYPEMEATMILASKGCDIIPADCIFNV